MDNNTLANPMANNITLAKCKSSNLSMASNFLGFVAPTLYKAYPKNPPNKIANNIFIITPPYLELNFLVIIAVGIAMTKTTPANT